MNIVRFDRKGNCQLIYFNWRKFRFETSCWANNLPALLGKTAHRRHWIIGRLN